MREASLLDALVPSRRAAAGRSLTNLLSDAGLPAPPAGGGDPQVTGLSADSRQVRPGHVFVAVRGSVDGASFAASAVRQGAVAVVAGSEDQRLGVPWIRVASDRRALADLAATIHGRPSGKLLVAGVTGTNGKTTTTCATASILGAAGGAVGVMGTIETAWPGHGREAARTTPESLEIQATLADMVDDGCAACAMEVSSHGLDLDRVHGVQFAAVAFTNLTQDHLDWHRDMESYYRSKRRLFLDVAPEAPAVTCIDDDAGRRLAAELRSASSRRIVITTGFAADADLRIERLEDGATGSRFLLAGAAFGDAPPVAIQFALPGRHNAQNAAVAAGLALALDAPAALIAPGLAALRGVPGRLEPVTAGGSGPSVFVDYAHTPGALESVLSAARAFTRGRLICVFGCGGDKDREKRPLMGEAVGRLAHVAVLTSDNPRSEDPAVIMAQARTGLARGTAEVHEEADRRAAIELALSLAGADDVVVIAGKGHETSQEIAGKRLPFDDRVIAREILARRQS